MLQKLEKRVTERNKRLLKTTCARFYTWFLTCPKLQNDQFKNLYTSSHGEARNIKLGKQVNIIERVPLDTPPLAVVISLAHNHVIDLFNSSYRGATVIKFG